MGPNQLKKKALVVLIGPDNIGERHWTVRAFRLLTDTEHGHGHDHLKREAKEK